MARASSKGLITALGEGSARPRAAVRVLETCCATAYRKRTFHCGRRTF